VWFITHSLCWIARTTDFNTLHLKNWSLIKKGYVPIMNLEHILLNYYESIIITSQERGLEPEPELQREMELVRSCPGLP
jgi:hypothetical protein